MNLILLIASFVAAIAGNTTSEGKPWGRGVRIGFYVVAILLFVLFVLRWLNMTVETSFRVYPS